MKIKGNFIQASNGQWHNINQIRTFYVGAADTEIGYRICFTYEFGNAFRNIQLGKTIKTVRECQKELDEMMENL